MQFCAAGDTLVWQADGKLHGQQHAKCWHLQLLPSPPALRMASESFSASNLALCTPTCKAIHSAPSLKTCGKNVWPPKEEGRRNRHQ